MILLYTIIIMYTIRGKHVALCYRQYFRNICKGRADRRWCFENQVKTNHIFKILLLFCYIFNYTIKWFKSCVLLCRLEAFLVEFQSIHIASFWVWEKRSVLKSFSMKKQFKHMEIFLYTLLHNTIK